jgi:cell division protein ZapA
LPNVEISIYSRLYTVACDEGQESRMRALAGLVDMRVRQLLGDRPSMVGESHVLVLAGLMLADELEEANAALARAGEPAETLEEGDLLVAAVDHLADRISSIADRLDRA